MSRPDTDNMLARERIANRPKHWVRMVTACNSRCLFCLDADTPRNVILEDAEIKSELDRGLDVLGADKVILSGGEASLHPRFFEIIRYAKERGYDRVQTVTNGWRYAEREFYEQSIQAGLGEITFSLHGHTEALHDELTQHPGSFKRICKAILRAVRDRRVIANVDVVINGMNVEYIDKIVEFAIRLGVREFDLLHVIPQANAFDNRDRMFYDVRAHMERLHKVFKLNRHPGFVIWTNRFPVPWLEGLEDLIQDPHKMLDEVNGRRFMVRNYLDTGRPLDCRHPERCVHCFIEPFCTTMDRTMRRQREEEWRIWWVGTDVENALPTPPGAALLGVDVQTMAELESVRREGLGLYAKVAEATTPPALPDLVLIAERPDQLDAWVGQSVELVVMLNQATAPWIAANQDALAAHGSVQLHQPSFEHMSESAASDVSDPGDFFAGLRHRFAVSGLPACLVPGMEIAVAPARIDASMFDPETGRVVIRELARYHVRDQYRAKSVRCADCPLTDRCDGVHINMVRAQGLQLCRPVSGPWATDAEAQLTARWPTPPDRVLHGAPTETPPASLPGFESPTMPVQDPLAVIAQRLETRRLERAAARAKARAERERRASEVS